jgi:hypothetical protein
MRDASSGGFFDRWFHNRSPMACNRTLCLQWERTKGISRGASIAKPEREPAVFNARDGDKEKPDFAGGYFFRSSDSAARRSASA